MLIGRPQLDRGLGKRLLHRGHLLREVFLNASWAAGSALAWPQHALALVQTLEILPAALRMHLAPRVALDPAGDFGASPQPTICWRLLESLLELGLLLWREHKRAARIAVAAVAQAFLTLVIVIGLFKI